MASRRRLYSPMKCRMRRCMVTSSPIVGSSRNSTRGWCSRAAATSHFMRSPRERLRTGFCNKAPRSSKSTSSSSVARYSGTGMR